MWNSVANGSIQNHFYILAIHQIQCSIVDCFWKYSRSIVQLKLKMLYQDLVDLVQWFIIRRSKGLLTDLRVLLDVLDILICRQSVFYTWLRRLVIKNESWCGEKVVELLFTTGDRDGEDGGCLICKSTVGLFFIIRCW